MRLSRRDHDRRESTAWPGRFAAVVRPADLASATSGTWAGCTDTLEYMRQDPVFRKFHHDQLTFRGGLRISENFVLPLSHDEVVYGKGSLLRKMPGDAWQKFANLCRLLLGYNVRPTGKKLLFMGGRFGQWNEWNHDAELDWDLLILPSMPDYCAARRI